jgi:hypothetical protein
MVGPSRLCEHADQWGMMCSVSHNPEPRRYTVSAVSRCICAVFVLYLALYFWNGGVTRGGHCICAVSAISLLNHCCICAVSAVSAVSLLYWRCICAVCVLYLEYLLYLLYRPASRLCCCIWCICTLLLYRCCIPIHCICCFTGALTQPFFWGARMCRPPVWEENVESRIGNSRFAKCSIVAH